MIHTRLSRKKVWATTLMILLLLFLASRPVMANEAQYHILCVGINLGWAEATLQLQGDTVSQHVRLVADSLERAAQHVQASASLFGEPYRTELANSHTLERLIIKIRDYARRAPRFSLNEKQGYVSKLYGHYRQSFQTTYDNIQGMHYQTNCDLFLLDTGYHFGRAQIAAGVQGNRARTYQNGAVFSMKASIRNGLTVALDGYSRDRIPIGSKKVCCAFGTEREWGRLPNFQRNSPFTLFASNLSVIQMIVRNARLAPGACAGSEPKSRHGLPDLSGTWRASVENLVYQVNQDGEAFTWSVNRYSETASGRFVDSTTITVNWRRGAISGSATGKLVVNSAGRATQIRWSNGVNWNR